MRKKIKYSTKQGLFYDVNPPLSPWQNILSKKGLSLLYKPREIFWKKHLDTLEIKKGNSVLDVGCGQGIFLSRLAKTYGIKGTGIDISKESINYANKNFSSDAISFLRVDAEKLPFEDERFDFVVSFDSLEHIEDQNKAISEMIRVLKKGGKILIYTLNKNYKYTLDYVWEKLGFDIFTKALHRKELFVDPLKLKNSFEKKGVKTFKIDYIDAFFTLAVDEIIMVNLLMYKKFRLTKRENFGNLVMTFWAFISNIIYFMINFIDQLWYRKNISVGFIVIGKK